MRAVRPRIATQATHHFPRSDAEQATLLGEVIERYGRIMRAHARRHSRNSEEAEDALQDACLIFLAKYEGPADVERAIAWLSVVTRHRAWQIGRRERREATRRSSVPAEGDPLAGLISGSRGPDELAEIAALTTLRIANLWRLKRNERIALVLLAIGYSYAEIGERLRWTQTKVNRCIFEGRAALREMEEGGRE